MKSMEQAEPKFETKYKALQVVVRMAFDYVEGLKPGDRYLGLQTEAAKHFDIGSEAYGLFIGCGMHQMTKFVMDVDDERRIISIVRVKQ